MLFKGKSVNVIITGEAKIEFKELSNTIREEISGGITNSNHQTLFNSIKQKIEYLKKNPQYGVHISKNKIAKEYIVKYEVNNLWKVNLSKAWRMIYTIKGSQIEIIALILDIIDHKTYSKKFKYKK